MSEGVIISIHVSSKATEPMRSVHEVTAVPGKGLEGDRYFEGVGTFSGKPGPGGLPPARDLTLIEIEAIEAIKRESGIELDPGDARRNVVTRNVPLNHLVDKEFTLGQIRLRGVRLCEPCELVQELTGKEILKPMVHRGGLRAHILTRGLIRVGDTVGES